ncbi:MAG: UDP-N-acetylmuramate--L-alanine ligase, partial [Candidatus Eremiobacteraeota bacterium]|nr:UDP-N-acetylmuramate--L-alanine ligase [Candidatus Eremiobacteraeota bacterium]
HVLDVDVVVVSSAIKRDNPEWLEARKRRIPVVPRAEMLAELMRFRRGIAIAGTHGKTTTTSMVAKVLDAAAFRPTVIIGGEVNDMGSNAKLGGGFHLVAEADESDASFVHLEPKIAIVTNMDSDVNLSAEPFRDLNFDTEETMVRVKQMFEVFSNRLPQDGRLILCWDHERVRELGAKVDRPTLTYGFSSDADLTVKELELDGLRSRAEVVYKGEALGIMTLHVPGKHNVCNALAAIAVGLELGIDPATILSALAKFEGVQRRFQILGQSNGVTVVDDYAHNPQKVEAALHAAKVAAKKSKGRVVAVFQPHRYTRTKFLYNDFLTSFHEADLLLVTDIYSAGEPPILGLRVENLVSEIGQKSPHVEIFHTPKEQDVMRRLDLVTKPGDIVITLGAGDVGRWGSRFLLHDTNDHLVTKAVI